MKATILMFACGLLGLTGCAVQTREELRAQAAQSPFGYNVAKSVPAAASPVDLLGAAARGDLRGVQGALAQGASVEMRNPNGATALLLAATSGSLPVVQDLLGAGADVNAADNNGRTPLAAATAGGYDDIARALKAAGARGAAAPSPDQAGGSGQWWKVGGAH